jgi:hypothetical protein
MSIMNIPIIMNKLIASTAILAIAYGYYQAIRPIPEIEIDYASSNIITLRNNGKLPLVIEKYRYIHNGNETSFVKIGNVMIDPIPRSLPGEGSKVLFKIDKNRVVDLTKIYDLEIKFTYETVFGNKEYTSIIPKRQL